jgi:hypothetical protein
MPMTGSHGLSDTLNDVRLSLAGMLGLSCSDHKRGVIHSGALSLKFTTHKLHHLFGTSICRKNGM